MKADLFSHLTSLKARLDAHRPLPKAVLRNLHEDMVVRMTYNSNAIEGNTLTLKETKVALEGVTIGGKSIREHLEAINHREAILYVERVIANSEPLTLHFIKGLHQLILKGIDDEWAGVWRKSNVIIAGATHVPPSHIQVPEQMEALANWYSEARQDLHPVELAAQLHSDFVKIHPFVDGNGRTARLLMNFELMKNGFPPLILPVEKRLEYYEALDRAHVEGDRDLFVNLIAGLVEQSFEPYWYVLGEKS